jgi:hypothetical protein
MRRGDISPRFQSDPHPNDLDCQLVTRWTSKFEPTRINGLQSSSRDPINASEGLLQAWSMVSGQNRPQVTKNVALTAKRRVWRV